MSCELTANRSDEEPWRIERLREVAKECPPNVIGLHDHKGTLAVNWSSAPTIADLTAVVQACMISANIQSTITSTLRRWKSRQWDTARSSRRRSHDARAGSRWDPTIPVRVWYEDRWRKQPLERWDDATTDCETLARWERKWPEALPGVPLERVGWCAIDVDADDPAFWEIWNGLGPRGPYSEIQTVSGGWHFVFAQCDPPIGKMQWSERNGDVEIRKLLPALTVYDVVTKSCSRE